MRGLKLTIIPATVVAIALALAATAIAQQGNGMRRGLANGLAGIPQLRQLARGLQLTQPQRDEIRTILQAHKADIVNAREAVLRARLALTKEEPNGPGDFGAAQARVQALRQDILKEIKGKLTEDQIAKSQAIEKRRADRLEKALQQLQLRAGGL